MDLYLLKEHGFRMIENRLSSHSGSYVRKPVTSEWVREQAENLVIK